MGVLQYFLSDGIMQVRFHVFEHKVKVFLIVGFHYIVQLYDIWMIELMQEDNLSVSSLRICRMLKGIEYFLQGENLTGFFIRYFPDMSIGSTSNLLNEGIFL
jgi:hypothetical protein